MKTAEEWFNERSIGAPLVLIHIKNVEAIQQDAFRAGEINGMEKAAKIVGQDAILQPSNDAWQLLTRRKEAIRTAIEQLKKL